MTDVAPTVLVIAADRLFAESAAAYLERHGWRAEVLAGDGIAALAAFDAAGPDAVLLSDDVERIGASQLATQMRRRRPDTTVVLFGQVESPNSAVVSRRSDGMAILQALAASPGPRPENVPRASELVRLSSLTPRERTVLRLLIEGHKTVEMASQLGVSAHTVRTHVQRLYAKVGCHTRAEIIGFASRVGLVIPGRDRVPPG